MTSLLAVPVTFMGTCCGSCASYCACKTLTCKGELSTTISRIMYLAFLFAYTLLAIILQQFGRPIVLHLEWGGIQYDHDLCTRYCMGDEAVYRISMGLTLFFIIMSMCTSTISQFSTNAQKQYWILKLVGLAILVFTSPMYSDEFINIYKISCKYASTLFLLIQMCILIDFGYVFNEKLISYNSDIWKLGLVTVSFGLNIAMIIMICMFYTNIVYGVVMMSTNIIMTGMSISPIAPHGTLLTSSIVGFQNAYIYMIGYGASNANTLLGGAVTAMSLVFTAYSTSKTNVFHINQIPEANELILLDSTIVLDEENQVCVPEEKKNEKVVSGLYHITLALSSMYMPLLLVGFDHTTSIHPEIIIAQIFCSLLYTWTLVAPSICKNRDFN